MKNIKLLVMDVDGTLTDGHIYIGADGEAFKAFDVKDGYGIAHLLPEHNITPVIITGRNSKIVECRAKELKINELHQGISDKLSKLKEVCDKYNCNLDEVAYIGDDLNDLDCIKEVGYSACPNDAIEDVKKHVNYICDKKSGYGAVREFIELLKK